MKQAGCAWPSDVLWRQFHRRQPSLRLFSSLNARASSSITTVGGAVQKIPFIQHGLHVQRLYHPNEPQKARRLQHRDARRQPPQELHHPLDQKSSLPLPQGSGLPPERYSPPIQGFFSLLPTKLVPYAELARLDKPTGAYYLFLPCAWSLPLAARFIDPLPPLADLGFYTALFFTGALVMRGAGCTINDLWDRDFDKQVHRTKLRPLARGALTVKSAIPFLGLQLSTGLAILLCFPTACFWYAVPSLLLVATYPLAKRVTNYPQLVLALTFSWGAIMGFPALGVDLIANQQAAMAAGLLYASNAAWVVLYDFIYAHMDLRDDVGAGVKSIAVKHAAHTKEILAGLAVVQTLLLAGAGMTAGAGPVFYAIGLGGSTLSLAIMINRVRLYDWQDCWSWFRRGCWFVGGSVWLGLLGDYTWDKFQVTAVNAES